MVVEKFAHDLAVAVGECHVLDVRHETAASRTFVDAHADLRVRGPSIAAFAPHLDQRSDAAFVASPPGFHPLTDPGFFLGQSLVKEGVLLLFGVQEGFFALEERIVVAGPVKQPAAIDFHDSIGNVSQEHAIVRDKDQGSLPPREEIFEPGNRRNVHVIRRFVEQQQFRGRDERLSQQDAALHAG